MSDAFDPYYRWLGIPPKDQPPDHYRLLSVERFESHPDVIAEAADRQMAHLRTRHAGPHAALAARLLNEIAAARVCLLSLEKKSAYDEHLALALQAESTKASQTPSPSRSRWFHASLIAVIVIICFVGGWGLNAYWHAGPEQEGQLEIAREKIRSAASDSSLTEGESFDAESAGSVSDFQSIQATPPDALTSSADSGVAASQKPISLPAETGPAKSPSGEQLTAKRKDPSIGRQGQEGTKTPLAPTSIQKSATENSDQNSTSLGATSDEKHGKTSDPTSRSSKSTNHTSPETTVGNSTEASNSQLACYALGNDALVALAMSFDGRRLSTINAKNQFNVIDLQAGSESQSFSAADLQVGQIALVPDGRFMLATGIVEYSGSAQLRTYRISAAAELNSIPISQGRSTALAISANGALFALGHADGVVTLHSSRNPSQSVTLFAKTRSVEITSMLFSSDNQHLVFGDDKGEVHTALVSARKPTVLQHLAAHNAPIHSLGISLQGDVLMTAAADGFVRLWKNWRGRDDAEQVLQLEAPARKPGRAALSPSGKIVAVAGARSEINLWHAASGKPLATLPGHTAAVVGLEFLPQEDRLVSASSDGTVRIWQCPKPVDATVESNVELKVASAGPEDANPVIEVPISRRSTSFGNSSNTIRLPLPSNSERTQSKSTFDRTFGVERAEATQNVARLNLAQKLIQQAETEATSPADRFVLLSEAQELAAQAGNTRLAYALHDQLADSFEIDAPSAVVLVSQQLARTADTAVEKLAAARAALDHVPMALANDRIDAARQLCAAAIETIGDPSKTALKSRLQQTLRHIDLAEQLLREARTIGLSDNRGDLPTDSRLALGQFFCFNRGDWPAGLEQFALAKQGELSTVATLDWSDPGDPDQQNNLAERWLALANSLSLKQDPGNDEPAASKLPRTMVSEQIAKSAALYWFKQALAGLTGSAHQAAKRAMERLESEEILIKRPMVAE